MSDDKLAKSNSRKAIKYRDVKCLNCGHPLDLSDVYCAYCSQLNSTKPLSIKDFFGEFLNSIVSYDSRLRHTLKDLLFKPGTITRNYVNGQRLKYANPFRFFLSVSIIYFLLQSLIATISGTGNSFVNLNNSSNTADKITDSIAKGIEVNQQLINENLAQLKNDSLLKNIPVVQIKDNNLVIDSDTIALDKEPEAEKEFKNISEEDLDTISWSNRIVERFILYNKFYEHTEIRSASKALDSMNHKNTSYNRWVYDKNSTIDRIKENPFGFMNYLMGKIPFFLFFFTPLFAVFFWLIYSKKRYTYMEHMVFIFHIFSFVFLLLLICLLPDLLIGDDVLAGIAITLIGPFYFYKALRNFYKQGRFMTIIKFVFLNIVFWLSTTIAAILFFAVTAATY